MIMCSNCHKRVAVIFVTKVEGGEKSSNGLCIKCAKQMGLPIENMLGDIYKKPAVVVDTHCIRLSNRFGLTKESDPVKIEFALAKIIPPDRQARFCHQLVLHGRAWCTARKPMCDGCPIAEVCPKVIKQKGN